MIHVKSSVALGAYLFLLLTVSAAGIAHAQSAVKASEKSLRKIAVKTVMPTFPDESLKRGTKGVAVIELEIDVQGDVVYAKILEAPDTLTGEATIAAVKQWKFSPTTIGEHPVKVQGKLTFYFVIDERGGGRVENPKQFN